MRTHHRFVHKRTLDHLAKLAKWFSCVLTTYLYGAFECMFWSCHICDSEWIHTLNSCLNVQELVTRSRRKIWSLSDCNWTRTHNHLVWKRTLNYLAKLAKWLSCVVRNYLYSAFDCMFLSCQVCVSQSIHALYSCLNVKELFAWSRLEIWSIVTATGLEPTTLSS